MSIIQVYYKTPKGPQYWPTVKQRVFWKFGMHRPWTDEHHMANMPGKNIMPELIEPIKDWSFFIGDRVSISFQQLQFIYYKFKFFYLTVI